MIEFTATIYFIFSIVLVLSFSMISIFLLFLRKNILRYLALKNYEYIDRILTQSKSLCFSKIYKEDLLIYSSSGYTTNYNEIKKFSDKYVKLVLTSCGQNIVRDLELIFGDLESICITLSNEFIEMVIRNEGEFLNIQKDE